MPFTSPRPRPVADAPVDLLVAGAQDTAKGWLLELLGRGPLHEAVDLPVAELARNAPALCAAMARALGDDRELDRLCSGGDLEGLAAGAGSLAGAADPQAGASAIEALRKVTWSVILPALDRPTPAQVSDLAERLAHVSQVVLGATLRDLGPAPREDVDSTPGSGARVTLPPEAPVSLQDNRAPVAGAAEDPAPWITTLERRLERQSRDGEPVAALLVELDGLDRLLAAETGREVATAIEAVERAVCGGLRPADALVRESLGRYWIVAPHTDRAGARVLAAQLDQAVRASASHRGAALSVSIGIAVGPGDGVDAQELSEFADQDLFAARADGRATSGRPAED